MSKLPRDWLPALTQLLERELAVVRIVIAETRGSAPRGPGAFMLVGRNEVEGTIGGGRLEWDSVAAARELLDDAGVAARLKKVVLGADVGQCCGGVVGVWLERFTREDLGLLYLASDAGARGAAVLSTTIRGAAVERRLLCGAGVDEATDRLLRASRDRAQSYAMRNAAGELAFLERLDDGFPALWLYGAGHVGQSLARILMELPLRLTWIDSRAGLFPAMISEGAVIRCDADPVATVSEAPSGAHFLVMTHSHPLDYSLCHAILRRGDFAWLGLIGSQSKAARFRSRLRRDGMGAAAIARLVCPIGIEGIESKWPAAIAVGVAAQVMQQISAGAPEGEGLKRPERPQRGERLELADLAQPPRVVERLAGVDEGSAPIADCAPENCANCGARPS
jgi:xanthine dehydrogenase accessory factor